MPRARKEQFNDSNTVQSLHEILSNDNTTHGVNIDLTQGSALTSSDGNVTIIGGLNIISGSAKGGLIVKDDGLHYQLADGHDALIRTYDNSIDTDFATVLKIDNNTGGKDLIFTNGSNILIKDNDFNLRYLSGTEGAGGNINIKAQDGNRGGNVNISSGSNGLLNLTSSSNLNLNFSDSYVSFTASATESGMSFTHSHNAIINIETGPDNSSNTLFIHGGNSGSNKAGGPVNVVGGRGLIGGDVILSGGEGAEAGGNILLSPGTGGMVKINSPISIQNGLLNVHGDVLTFKDNNGHEWNLSGHSSIKPLRDSLNAGNTTSGKNIVFSGDATQDGIDIAGVEGSDFNITYLNKAKINTAAINIVAQSSVDGSSMIGGSFVARAGNGGSAGGVGGTATLQAGNGGGIGNGGKANIIGGIAGGTNANGGEAALLGGNASGKGSGGLASITGGGSPRGNTGDILISTQSSKFGSCGSINIFAGDSIADGHHGGNVSFKAGGGSGKDGIDGSIYFGLTSKANNATIQFKNNNNAFVEFSPNNGMSLSHATGTITIIGSNSRCKKCNRDMVIEAKNTAEKWHKAICVSCLVDALDRYGINRNEYMTIDE